MKDSIKSLFLLLLFLTSIFLSKHIWVSDVDNLAKKTRDENIEDIDIDLLRPYKVLVNFNKRNHTIKYGKDTILWDESKDYIREGFTSRNISIEEIKRDEYKDYLKKKSIVFHFPKGLNTYLLGKSLNIDKMNSVTEDIAKTEYIYLSLHGKERFLILSWEDRFYKISNFSIDVRKLNEELSRIEKDARYTGYYPVTDSMEIDSLLYIPYNMLDSYPYVYMGDIDRDNYLRVARKNSEEFFKKDIDYIREVVEGSGSILHIYDKEVLKYGTDGSLEYFNPMKETIRERNLLMSLRKSSEFLQKHIDDSGKYYLSELREIESKGNLGYRFIFKSNIDGIELLDLEDDSDYIYIDVYNSHVQRYRKYVKRDIKKDYPDEEAVSAFDILNTSYEILKEGYLEFNDIDGLGDDELVDRVYEDIEDISIYYIEDDDKRALRPVWLFETGRIAYVFDIYTGELISKIKID